MRRLKQQQRKQKQPSACTSTIFFSAGTLSRNHRVGVCVASVTLFAIASVFINQLQINNARTQIAKLQSNRFFRQIAVGTSTTTEKAVGCVDGQSNVSLFSSQDTNVTSLDAVLAAGGHAVKNSYHLQSEVESITHVPSEAKVVVRFKSDTERKCKKPRIFGRLSGKYLSVIYWDTDAVEKMDPDGLPQDLQVKTSFTHTETLNVITGYYNVPAKGRYFIEIIGLFCNDFPFDYDFSAACLENVDHNRLTATGAHVDVSKTFLNLQSLSVFQSSRATNAAAQVPGYWKWSSNTTVEPVPLMTRYQRQNCINRQKETKATAECLETASLERFEPYTFEWLEEGGDNSDLEHYAFDRVRNETFKLCAVGASHSRVLIEHLQVVIDEFNMTDIEVLHISFTHPREMMGRFKKFVWALDCNLIIVGFGQWSAGKPPATTFPDYYNEYKQGIDSWLTSKMNLVIRKTHYNPLGAIKNTCPPLGWRNPSVIDTYNEIARRIANESNVPFLDGGYLMDPMWDSARDYNHYSNQAGKMETIFFLRKIIDMNTRFKFDKAKWHV